MAVIVTRIEFRPPLYSGRVIPVTGINPTCMPTRQEWNEGFTGVTTGYSGGKSRGYLSQQSRVSPL
jgi:hypothetical protein